YRLSATAEIQPTKGLEQPLPGALTSRIESLLQGRELITRDVVMGIASQILEYSSYPHPDELAQPARLELLTSFRGEPQTLVGRALQLYFQVNPGSEACFKSASTDERDLHRVLALSLCARNATLGELLGKTYSKAEPDLVLPALRASLLEIIHWIQMTPEEGK